MKKRLLFALPILIPTLAMACFPSEPRFSDDDDDAGDFDFTTGTSSGSGTTSGAGGATSSTTGSGGTTTTGTTSSGVGSTTSTAATTGSGMNGGICNSGLTTGSDGHDLCISNSCCSSFDLCMADSACQSCMTGSGSGCETNSLYQSFDSCNTGACPVQICDTGIALSDGNGDPAFACNECGSNNCCSPADTCVAGGSQTEISTCITCLNDETDPTCTSASSSVQAAATEFNSCLETYCASQCGL